MVPSDTNNFNIPLGGEHPYCKKFRNKANKKTYGGGTKYVFLLPVTEFIQGIPTLGKPVTSNSTGAIVPYANYNPGSDWLTRCKTFGQYNDLAIWNDFLPNKDNILSIINELRCMPQYHHLSVACIGYDSLSVSIPDVQLGLTGSVEHSDHLYEQDPKKYAAAREVWEELGLSGKKTSTCSTKNTFPLENCILSTGNSFLFVIN